MNSKRFIFWGNEPYRKYLRSRGVDDRLFSRDEILRFREEMFQGFRRDVLDLYAQAGRDWTEFDRRLRVKVGLSAG